MLARVRGVTAWDTARAQKASFPTKVACAAIKLAGVRWCDPQHAEFSSKKSKRVKEGSGVARMAPWGRLVWVGVMSH